MDTLYISRAMSYLGTPHCSNLCANKHALLFLSIVCALKVDCTACSAHQPLSAPPQHTTICLLRPALEHYRLRIDPYPSHHLLPCSRDPCCLGRVTAAPKENINTQITHGYDDNVNIKKEHFTNAPATLSTPLAVSNKFSGLMSLWMMLFPCCRQAGRCKQGR